MTFGRGPLLIQKYIILQKLIKTTIVTLTCFSWHYVLRQRVVICLQSIDIAVKHCVTLLRGVA